MDGTVVIVDVVVAVTTVDADVPAAAVTADADAPAAAVTTAAAAMISVPVPDVRHTGKASHIAFVKCDAAVRKAFEIRGLCPVTAVWGKHVTVQGIVHYHDCFHNFSPSLLICSN